MELEPKIRGKKTKAIRVEESSLTSLREELKASKQWAHYADAADSELLRLAVMLARLHMQPDVFMLTTDAVQTLVDEAVRFSIAEVAGALGGVAQLKPDGTMTVARIESDSVATFPAKPLTVTQPLTVPRPALMH